MCFPNTSVANGAVGDGFNANRRGALGSGPPTGRWRTLAPMAPATRPSKTPDATIRLRFDPAALANGAAGAAVSASSIASCTSAASRNRRFGSFSRHRCSTGSSGRASAPRRRRSARSRAGASRRSCSRTRPSRGVGLGEPACPSGRVSVPAPDRGRRDRRTRPLSCACAARTGVTSSPPAVCTARRAASPS